MPNGIFTYKRGEIWWVDLKPVVGKATDKERPCLILQNDIGNQNGLTTIVAPLLPGTKSYPFVVNVRPTPQNGLRGEPYINLSQMRAVDARRIKNKQGTLEDFYWEEIEGYPLKAGQIRGYKKERSSFLSRLAVVAKLRKLYVLSLVSGRRSSLYRLPIAE